MESLHANRETIANKFKTDYLTTARILSNCCYGFFISMFGESAQDMWKAAHPFKYQSGAINYHALSVEFIEQHFELFASNQFTTWAGWGNDENGNFGWQYKSWYRIEPIVYSEEPHKVANGIQELLYRAA